MDPPQRLPIIKGPIAPFGGDPEPVDAVWGWECCQCEE